MRHIILGFATLALATFPLAAEAQTTCPNCGPSQGQVVSGEVVGGEVVGGNCDTGVGGGGLIARLRARCQSGECVPQTYGNPDLFYNFWVAPGCNAEGGGAAPTPNPVGAQLYVAPHPVPAYVGHTFYTYQPLMPHEMLYPHKRYYHRHYDEGRGYNRTAVKWSRSPSYMARNVMSHFSLAR